MHAEACAIGLDHELAALVVVHDPS